MAQQRSIPVLLPDPFDQAAGFVVVTGLKAALGQVLWKVQAADRHIYSIMKFHRHSKTAPELQVCVDERGTCRICFESNSEPLIVPCRCDGSLKYIHESCLKCWIKAKHSAVDSSYCELCQSQFVMSIKYSTKVKCSANSGELRPHSQLAFVLTIALLIVFAVSGYVTEQLLFQSPSQSVRICLALLLVILLVALISVLSILAGLCKKLCFHYELTQWTIQNRAASEEQEGPRNLDQENV